MRLHRRLGPIHRDAHPARQPPLAAPYITGAGDLAGHPLEQVRIIQSPLGGSFGVKTFARYVVLISLMAKKLGGRTVKWTEDRIEHLVGNSSHAWDRHHDCELALKRDGTITGHENATDRRFRRVCRMARHRHDAKAAHSVSAAAITSPTSTMTAKSSLPTKRRKGRTRLRFAAALLGHGAADRQGRPAVGNGPNEIRRRNFIKKEEFPYVSPSGNVYDSGDYEASLNLLLEKSGYAQPAGTAGGARARAAGRAQRRQQHRAGAHRTAHAGAGCRRACSAAHRPGGHTGAHGCLRQGHRRVGFPPGGQSQHTFVRQFLADYFGVAPEDVQVITVDSLGMQPGTGPISSSWRLRLSGAVLGAAARLADKLKRVAAVMLEASPDDVELFDGQLRVRGVPGKSLPVKQVALFMMARPDRLPEGIDGNPQATYVWNPPDRTIPDEQGRGRYSITAAGAQHLCMLEVDRDTGQVEILKYAMVDDCGVRMNPSVVRGMLMGGMAQGIGMRCSRNMSTTTTDSC